MRKFDWLRCRWEFMRRDPAYQEYYRRYQEHLRNGEIEEILDLDFDLGGHKALWNPDQSYDEIAAEIEPRNLALNVSSGVKQELLAIRAYQPMEWDFHKDGKLCFVIDPSKINSIDAFKDMMAKRFDRMWKDYQESTHKKPTKRLVDYEAILKAGDLKAGRTYQEVAKILFPRDFNESKLRPNPESAIKKVEQYCQKYQKLVNGGWRQMVFP